MNKEDYEFYYVISESFVEDQSFENYLESVQRWLMLSDWHYSAERAKELISDRMSMIEHSFRKKEPVSSAAVDVGYCCG